MINNYLRMKISKVLIFSICLLSGLFISVQSTLATDTTPVIIRKDDPVPPPEPKPLSMTQELPVSATIDDVQLVLYFDESVGTATIKVYDSSNNVICQQTADTSSSLEVSISSSNWNSGSYYVTITYGETSLIGDFDLE
jgi:hypothetical protein